MTSTNNGDVTSVTTYLAKDKPAAFRYSRDEWGQFSNMTGGFPITVNGIRFQSSEGLYQALKFPYAPEKQMTIARANSGYSAKQAQYSWEPYPFWDDDRVDAMRVALAFKLAQNPRFAGFLQATGERDIVESSNRDQFWGAKPIGRDFRGANVLGKLLMELRQALAESQSPQQAAMRFAEGAFKPRFRINGSDLNAQQLLTTAVTRPLPQVEDAPF